MKFPFEAPSTLLKHNFWKLFFLGDLIKINGISGIYVLYLAWLILGGVLTIEFRLAIGRFIFNILIDGKQSFLLSYDAGLISDDFVSAVYLSGFWCRSFGFRLLLKLYGKGVLIFFLFKVIRLSCKKEVLLDNSFYSVWYLLLWSILFTWKDYLILM